MLTWPAKDPSEVLDYDLDWSARLVNSETIVTSTWSITEGSVTIANSPAPAISGAVTSLWLTGGTVGDVCVLRNQITTSGGRTYDESVRLRVRTQ